MKAELEHGDKSRLIGNREPADRVGSLSDPATIHSVLEYMQKVTCHWGVPSKKKGRLDFSRSYLLTTQEFSVFRELPGFEGDVRQPLAVVLPAVLSHEGDRLIRSARVGKYLSVSTSDMAVVRKFAKHPAEIVRVVFFYNQASDGVVNPEGHPEGTYFRNLVPVYVSAETKVRNVPVDFHVIPLVRTGYVDIPVASREDLWK